SSTSSTPGVSTPLGFFASAKNPRGKLEIRSTKSETNSKFQNPNVQNRRVRLACLGHLNFGHSDLFRISDFGFESPSGRRGRGAEPSRSQFLFESRVLRPQGSLDVREE